jgi:hypothetical protein
VSALSDATLADPRDAIEEHVFGPILENGTIVGRAFVGHVIGGVLVDFVEGDLDVLYRRYPADWLRVLPLDDALGELDDENLEACMRYQIAIEPLT